MVNEMLSEIANIKALREEGDARYAVYNNTTKNWYARSEACKEAFALWIEADNRSKELMWRILGVAKDRLEGPVHQSMEWVIEYLESREIR